MMKCPRILIIDDDPDVRLALALLLKGGGYEALAESDPRSIPRRMAEGRFDAILLDMNFSNGATDGKEGLFWLKEILARDPEAMAIPVSAYGDVGIAVAAIKEGATDFILKPWNDEKLLASLGLALRLRASEAELRRMRSQRRQLASDADQRLGEMIGEGPAMQAVLALIRKVAATDAAVLITGENGTGKELVARAIHRQSDRREGAFIGVDIASLPESLFESELFGHAKGAFTDAKEARMGRFESACGGTLFLDEIGNLPMTMQAKLLRAIESGEIAPVGSSESRPVDARIVCASNMPLREMAARREFRQDLLYRINTIEIDLPPLRERREDIPLLAEHFLSLYCRKYRMPTREIPPEAMSRLRDYPWPGNIRELKHAIERAVIVGDSADLRPEDFLAPRPGTPPCEASSGQARIGGDLESMERAAIGSSLERNGGNISRAADELGLTRAALYRRIRKHGLQKLSP
jgi:two-component system, NtrC family, response regulator HydG